MKKRIWGVIFPVPERFINRFFEGKTVFLKYLPRRIGTLRSGMKLLFYASGGSKTIVGEALVEKLEFMPLKEALQRYSDKMFITKEEALEYAQRFGNRKEKDLLLLHLSNMLKYPKQIAYSKPITMAGQYLDKNGYMSIVNRVGPWVEELSN